MSDFIEIVAMYVQKYAPQYGICVCSPIIAQAILESAKGTSNKVKMGSEWRHNYFGLKWRNNRCPISNEYFEEWTKEQKPDGTYVDIVSKFCKFKNLESGVIGYFQWLDIPNYANLKGVYDPRTYLENIKADGYATSIDYVDNLMKVIESYDLTKYDFKGGIKVAKKVFLSAGHGGTDPGAVSGKLKEKDINLNIMLSCKTELERHGLTVVCSRLKDENDPVAQEVKEANASGADIAVSFHTNATPTGDGSETYYYPGSAGSKKLAELCEKHTKAIGQNSRGVKSGEKLMFVNSTKMIAVLCECAFIDNPKDNHIIDTVDDQKKFGVAYAKAILEYFGIAYKASTTSKSYKVQVTLTSETNAKQLQQKLIKDGYKATIV